MYCKNCGKNNEDSAIYCNNCGTRLDNYEAEDSSSFGFAVLGFFVPIAGLILFFIYEGKKPKRAKAAGKGALIGFITKIVLSLILVILYVVFAASLVSNAANGGRSNIPVIGDVYRKETTDEILEKYVDVSFGEFKVIDNGYLPETSLDITVKNKAEIRCTYFITIEAVDETGARIATDMIYADKLGAGQEISLKAFKFVNRDQLEQFKNATFRVLEINKHNY